MASKTGKPAARGRDIETILKGYILSPYCLGTALVLALFITIFTPGGLFEHQPIWLRGAIHLFDTVVFLAHTYFVLPLVFRVAFDRGWPILPAHVAIYIPLAFVLAVVFALVENTALSGTEVVWHVAIVVAWVVLSAVIGLFVFWVFFLPYAGIDVKPEQIWAYRKPTACRLQDHLSPAVRGRVHQMLAENQYVRVFTERGEELIRMPLSDAVDLVPDEVGIRVHRSHWIATDRMAGVRFESGNPKLITIDGTQLPVSRARVDDVRSALSLRET
ncbi:MAG: LytTR family DNA-binding domain-containing protein [Pseudomonadota bacterium]|nr:LytTR family DNA-binding domain-containing protein [Pseudomonadota bacterium]